MHESSSNATVVNVQKMVQDQERRLGRAEPLHDENCLPLVEHHVNPEVQLPNR